MRVQLGSHKASFELGDNPGARRRERAHLRRRPAIFIGCEDPPQMVLRSFSQPDGKTQAE